MAAKKKSAKASKSSEPVAAEEKIARALGLLLVRNMEQKTEQVTLLRSIGFDVADVAALLGITENHVNQATFQGRKKNHKKSTK